MSHTRPEESQHRARGWSWPLGQRGKSHGAGPGGRGAAGAVPRSRSSPEPPRLSRHRDPAEPLSPPPWGPASLPAPRSEQLFGDSKGRS